MSITKSRRACGGNDLEATWRAILVGDTTDYLEGYRSLSNHDYM